MRHYLHISLHIIATLLAIFAARDIAVGEELTFFYPSTEWEMARPFACACGAPECIRLVASAKYLAVDSLSRYFINPHIRDMINETLTQHPALALQSVPVPVARANGYHRHESTFLSGI